jgi:uncharacterized BrkB/YihY/UPF0761 family membrane protein
MIGTIGFAAIAAAIVVVAFIGQRRRAQFATFGEVLDRVMTTQAARICILTFWWWLGWHFLVVRTVDPVILSH